MSGSWYWLPIWFPSVAAAANRGPSNAAPRRTRASWNIDIVSGKSHTRTDTASTAGAARNTANRAMQTKGHSDVTLLKQR
jgi:hypothetical protein